MDRGIATVGAIELNIRAHVQRRLKTEWKRLHFITENDWTY